MPLGDFVDSGTSPKPLVIGRTLRFLFGLGATFYFVYNLVVYDALVGTDLPELGYFIPIAIAWWYFSDAFIVGLGLPWGRWPQIAVVPVIAALIGFSFIADGDAWGSPVAWGVYIASQFFFGFIGPSFILAAIFAVPG
ncbi:MAG: hypothetical protein VB860_05245 [Dehalococcoidia bacterium]